MKKLIVSAITLFCFFQLSRAQNVLAYYPFTINANDSSGNGNNATLLGSAYVNNGLHIGNNDTDEAILPLNVFNGLVYFDLSFSVKFDTVQVVDSLARNTILYGGNPLCGPIPLGLFYSKISTEGQPANSWMLFFNNVPYFIKDSNVVAGVWYNLDISKQGGNIGFYKDNVLLKNNEDESDSVTFTIPPDLGQYAGCIGSRVNKSLWGQIKALKVTDYDNTTGVGYASSLAHLNTYPNPTTGQLTISNNQFRIVEAQIENILGQTVIEKSFSIAAQQQTVDVSSLSAGIYICKLSTPGGQLVTGKFVKQ